MRDRSLAALSAVVTVLAALAHTVPGIVLARWLTEYPDWLPVAGTNGQTVTVYSQVSSAIGPLVTLSLALGVGFYAGRRLDVRREYRRFAAAVATGSGAALVIVSIAILVFEGLSGSLDAFAAIVLLTSLLMFGATVTLPVVAGSLAGAAIAQFEADEESPARPTGHAADADPTRERQRTRAAEAEDVESRSAD